MRNLFLLAFVTTLLFRCSSPQVIVFSSDRAGNSDLYRVDLDGQQLQRLTDSPDPEWAPTPIDRARFSFLRQTDDSIDRYELSLRDGSTRQISQPANCELDDKNARYAPDGSRIAYECKGDIFLAEADGSNPRQLLPDLTGQQTRLCWFPAGDALAFTSDHEGQLDVYRVTVADEQLTNLSNHPANDEAPDISPDGQQLVYTSDREGNSNQDLFLHDLRTGTVRNITQTPDWELIGRWTPDGKNIIFGSNRDGNWELYRYDIRRDRTSRLTDDPGFDGDPRIINLNK